MKGGARGFEVSEKLCLSCLRPVGHLGRSMGTLEEAGSRMKLPPSYENSWACSEVLCDHSH